MSEIQTDVLVVGAGPAGSAAATYAARAGHEVTLIDSATFPRDKPCGDGLTPRAIAELNAIGLSDWLAGRARNKGLRAAGFGQELLLPWPGGSLPDYGGAAPRLELDEQIMWIAKAAGAKVLEGHAATDVVLDSGVIKSVIAKTDSGIVTFNANSVIIADGARSQLGRKLGREWHRDTAYGVAARGYIQSERHDDQWISSHLELRGDKNEILSGYGWIFPLANGEVNVGVGTLATHKRPAEVNLRALMNTYADQQREDWKLSGDIRLPWSFLLPMGGAVSGIAGKNFMFIGDAAGCVNPLNGEGIDYGLETGRLAAEMLDTESDFSVAWPAQLRTHYGLAFSIARRLAGLLTVPGLLPVAGPVGMRSKTIMKLALRVMGNLVTDEDSDALAKVWRTAGRLSMKFDNRVPFPAADVRS